MERYGLPKACLLRHGWEFERVYRQGKRCHGDGFSIIYRPNALQFHRLGLSVQRKVGNAVRRNLVKRLFREVFRLNRDLFPTAADVVVTVRPGFSIERYGPLRQKVAAAVSAAGARDQRR